MVRSRDTPILHRFHIKIENRLGPIALNWELEHLIEVTIEQLPGPIDTYHTTAHQT